MRNSQIENVSDEAWSSLRVIDRVDLSGNRLNTLPPLLLTENITFRGIFVHGNPLYCECDERWLAPWLTSLCSALHEPDSVKCHAPNWLSAVEKHCLASKRRFLSKSLHRALRVHIYGLSTALILYHTTQRISGVARNFRQGVRQYVSFLSVYSRSAGDSCPTKSAVQTPVMTSASRH